jgi:hypothetical protein
MADSRINGEPQLLNKQELRIVVDHDKREFNCDFPTPETPTQLIYWLGMLDIARDQIKGQAGTRALQQAQEKMQKGIVGPDGQPLPR